MGVNSFDKLVWIYFKTVICMYVIVPNIQTIDPCTDYIEINDTFLTTTYRPSDVSSIKCLTYQEFKWYRYTGTHDGLLTSQCPTGLQCGSHTQIWINVKEEPPTPVNVDYRGTNNKWVIAVAIILVLLIIISMILIVLLYKKNNKYRKTHSTAYLHTCAISEISGDVARNKFNASNLN
ncbi:Oncoprotein-induced transcript 3 protein [Mactra antiquata]